LQEVKKYPHGHLFGDVSIIVQPIDPDCAAKLELGSTLMMRELEEIRIEEVCRKRDEQPFKYLLICRRANNFMNSVGQTLQRLTGDRRHNPAFMHPSDLLELGLLEGDIVRIWSAHGEIFGVVDSDDSVRPGVISMTHGFGVQRANCEENPLTTGASVSRLISLDESDPITGIPRMSALPVAVEKAIRL
jgi:anaerobic selenocysteine-containing dehydrogenase